MSKIFASDKPKASRNVFIKNFGLFPLFGCVAASGALVLFFSIRALRQNSLDKRYDLLKKPKTRKLVYANDIYEPNIEMGNLYEKMTHEELQKQ